MLSEEKNRVTVIGDAVVDYHYRIAIIPKPGDDEAIKTFSRSTGGSAANTAMGLSVLGADCAYCGCIGNDDMGDWILSEMTSVGLNISCVQKRKETGFVLALVDDDRERTMLSYRGQVEGYTLTEELKSTLKSSAILHLSCYSLLEDVEARSVFEAVKYAKENGALITIDTIPNVKHIKKELLKEMLGYADIMFTNRAELCFIAGMKDYEKATDKLLEQVPCIGLKMGGAGSMVAIRKGFSLPNGTVFEEKIVEKAPIVPVDVVDTTGAGDGFNAGFIWAVVSGKQPSDWIMTGNVVASKVVGQKPARFAGM